VVGLLPLASGPACLGMTFLNTTPQLAEGIMVDLRRDFWIRETGTGQQVAQVRERYMMMMIYISVTTSRA
jgi:hypothetical protein